MGTVAVLKDVILAFPNLVVPRSFPGGRPKFEAKFVFAPDSEASRMARAAIVQAARNKWPDDDQDRLFQELRQMSEDGRLPYHKKPRVDRSGAVYPIFVDRHFVSASAIVQPALLGRNREPLADDVAAVLLKHGAIVNAKVDFWAGDKFERRVNAGIIAVQFVDNRPDSVARQNVTQQDLESVAGVDL